MWIKVLGLISKVPWHVSNLHYVQALLGKGKENSVMRSRTPTLDWKHLTFHRHLEHFFPHVFGSAAYGLCLGLSVICALHGAAGREFWWLLAYGLELGEEVVAKAAKALKQQYGGGYILMAVAETQTVALIWFFSYCRRLRDVGFLACFQMPLQDVFHKQLSIAPVRYF